MSDMSIVPRRRGLALGLSALLPGLGQLYNGELNKGVILFLAFAFVTTPLVVLGALLLPPVLTMFTLLLSVGSALGLYGYGLWDAWRTAGRLAEYHPREWQQPGVYAALLLFAYLVVLGGMTAEVRSHLLESFRIPSDSMAPNVLRGDVLFADKRVNCPGCKHRLRRGDIAVFVYPNDRTLLYIKRIIGLPGDRVHIDGRALYVNGELMEVSATAGQVVERADIGRYTVNWPQSAPAKVDLRVPPGQVYVLGDNRAAAKDSRVFGTVPLMDVVGIARQVWLSYEHGVRWGRLGKVL